jgi:hypothetical protein
MASQLYVIGEFQQIRLEKGTEIKKCCQEEIKEESKYLTVSWS